MGCDGGTIPRRDELVKTKKKAEAVSASLFDTIISNRYVFSFRKIKHQN